jgi:hypothetical protein
MQTFREQIVEEISYLKEQLEKKYQKLNEFDFESKFNNAKQFLGKCYIEIDINNSDYIRCFYVYEVDEINATLNSLEIWYFKSTNQHFQITHSNHFHPINDRDYSEYKEITKEEFDAHFEIVNEYITNMKNTELC